MADFPVATDGSERRVIDFRAHEPDVNDLRGRIESAIPYFCVNPSCIHAYCPLHRKGFIRLALACRQVDHACLRKIQQKTFLPLLRPYHELRATLIQKARLAEDSAFEILTTCFE
jgi:hypothetical protein